MTKTAEQRRLDAQQEYNAFLADCPTRDLLMTISEKWYGLVLNAIADGASRFSEIGRTVAGVSQKMLTQTLRRMERDGIVVRTVTPSVPVRVDYTLTPLGESLRPVMAAIKAWSESNIEDVRAARTHYDDRPAA
ncbi:helix-turn-helix domain-containing protein [Sanguibacter sp. 25GB23B1]|uniref:winged helix-turn-helix transcriptional regulator n=1 Tax=unclassified Sanguibacter TaxID=2645534 RepID=UPI0032AF9B4E